MLQVTLRLDVSATMQTLRDGMPENSDMQLEVLWLHSLNYDLLQAPMSEPTPSQHQIWNTKSACVDCV